MDFAFKLKGLELTATEAKSLLNAADQKTAFVIDLEQHVDAKILSAPDLFALSIEKKDPTLAALASRFRSTISERVLSPQEVPVHLL